MRFRGHAFVDWDDTIAENILYFNMAEEANAQLIARLTATPVADVRQRGQELDLEVARRVGLGKDSLWMAWCECYQEFCSRRGQAVDADAEEAIKRSCRLPYETRQDLLPGAEETLQWLHAQGFEVTIWTAGDHDVQSRKIEESGLLPLIHRTQIVPDKTPERLQGALEGRDPAACFVVGNSIHSDIRPALALSLPAFHIPKETWAYDHGRLDLTDSNYHAIRSIGELPPALVTRFRLAV